MNRLLFSLLFFLLVSRLFRLDVPDTYYFDEVYHAFTAQAYAENDPRGYEWWHEAPESFAYEWLHPPTAKLVQAGSIRILGDNPFAWRFPSVIFGTAIGLLLFLIGKEIFKSWRVGIFALSFWTLDGLSLTLSRITMNDIFLTFLLLLAFYLFFSKKPLLLTGAALGLAVSTKWSGIFAVALVALFWFRENYKSLNIQKLVLASFTFLLLPVIVYFLSYTQFFFQGHTLDQFRELHSQTWWYQTNLTAAHPYSSTAFQWPLGIKPLYAYTDGKNNIYFSGNPVLWWGGLFSALFLLTRLRRLDFKIKALLLFYFAMFLPWAFSPRIMFIYHYLPALPFLFLVLAYVASTLWTQKKVWIVGSLIVAILSFAIYYPSWTALATPSWWPRF